MAKKTFKEYKEMQKEKVAARMHSGNDVRWYSKNPQLLKDSCNVPFSYMMGNKVTIPGNSGSSDPIFNKPLPGVMAFPVAPLPGNPQETNSPVNIAARAIYGYVRHANSGSKVYDIPDLMLYLLGIDSLYMLFSYLKRIYGIVSYYSTKNRYTGRAMLTAMGVNYDSILQNLADFRQFLNTFALKIGALVVPKEMTYFMRHMWMMENVYRDADHEKSQFYMYVPEYFYIYRETGSPQGNYLATTGWLGYHRLKASTDVGLKDFIDLMEMANEMIDAMMGSEDCGIMSGDIQKAYGDANVWKLSATVEDYQCVPTFNQEVLTQFHNVETLTNGTDGSSYTFNTFLPTQTAVHSIRNKVPVTFGQVTQSIQGIGLIPTLVLNNVYSETVPCSFEGPNQVHLLDVPYTDATPENVMVASRCQFNKYSTRNNNEWTRVLTDAGSEVITRLEIWMYDWSSGTPELRVRFTGTDWLYAIDRSGSFTNYAPDAVMDLTIMERWDYHPIIKFDTIHLDTSTTPSTFTGAELSVFSGDLDNYTIISADVLRRINEVALLSQFDTPQAGVWKLQ
jgi:hypothetical protein